MPGIALFSISTLFTVAGLWFFLRLNGKIGMVDVPNERSSHSNPVARGGGLVIVLVSLALYVATAEWQSWEINWVFIGLAVLIAAVSFLDDLFTLPLLPRLLVHVVAAVVITYYSGGFTGIHIPMSNSEVDLGYFGPVITVFFIVWAINAFNFMDGIDGIAGIQGLFASLGWAFFGSLAGSQPFSMYGAIFAGSCLGFLFFNWQPAKVFLGDVGSTYLGFCLACAPLIFKGNSAMSTGQLFYLSIMFLWLFLYDTALTRIGQMVRRKKFWLAHREHQYQLLVIGGFKHSTVTFFFGVSALLICCFSVLAISKGGVFEILTALLVFLLSTGLTLWTLKKRLT